ncbi:hypothetical protein JS756_22635 [Streptomyces actuosus]|uniref:Uncharacterized protein n=1 Tax=Streptomyces actuosus TaxID=1885 RepID=A0ABS2VUQ4_STRAS|nr:hypothetical protein [Streptomyces actuosus]MBN0046857.1 hypothetical protein [Streptomyces actuosus]
MITGATMWDGPVEPADGPPATARDLAQHIAAVSFDGETGRVGLQP